jgi:hypothetical protein
MAEEEGIRGAGFEVRKERGGGGSLAVALARVKTTALASKCQPTGEVTPTC